MTSKRVLKRIAAPTRTSADPYLAKNAEELLDEVDVQQSAVQMRGLKVLSSSSTQLIAAIWFAFQYCTVTSVPLPSDLAAEDLVVDL